MFTTSIIGYASPPKKGREKQEETYDFQIARVEADSDGLGQNLANRIVGGSVAATTTFTTHVSFHKHRIDRRRPKKTIVCTLL